jgi:hypothetical protein
MPTARRVRIFPKGARAIPVSISIHPELKTKLPRPLQRGFAPFAMYRIVVEIAVLAWAAGVIGR